VVADKDRGRKERKERAKQERAEKKLERERSKMEKRLEKEAKRGMGMIRVPGPNVNKKLGKEVKKELKREMRKEWEEELGLQRERPSPSIIMMGEDSMRPPLPVSRSTEGVFGVETDQWCPDEKKEDKANPGRQPLKRTHSRSKSYAGHDIERVASSSSAEASGHPPAVFPQGWAGNNNNNRPSQEPAGDTLWNPFRP